MLYKYIVYILVVIFYQAFNENITTKIVKTFHLIEKLEIKTN